MTAETGFRLVRAPGPVDRVEALFAGAAYAPHRHDTYAIGITIDGVQRFDYRGSTRNSLPGGIVILHPDELHDGRAGDERPFGYRTAYVAPADILNMLDGRPLPFVRAAFQCAPACVARCWPCSRTWSARSRAWSSRMRFTISRRHWSRPPGGCRRAVVEPEGRSRARDYIDTRVEGRFRSPTWRPRRAMGAGNCRAISGRCLAPAPIATCSCAASTARGR